MKIMIRFTNLIFVSLLMPLILIGLMFTKPSLKRAIKHTFSFTIESNPGSLFRGSYPAVKQNPFVVVIHDWVNLSQLENLIYSAKEQAYKNYRVVVLSKKELLQNERQLIDKIINNKVLITISPVTNKLSFLPILYQSKDEEILTFISPESTFENKRVLSSLNQLYQNESTWGTLDPTNFKQPLKTIYHNDTQSELIGFQSPTPNLMTSYNVSSIIAGCVKIIPMQVLFNSMLNSSQNAISSTSPLIIASFSKHLSISRFPLFSCFHLTPPIRNSMKMIKSSNQDGIAKIPFKRKFNPNDLQSYASDKDLNIVVISKNDPLSLHKMILNAEFAWEDHLPIFVIYEASSPEIYSQYQELFHCHSNLNTIRLTLDNPSTHFCGILNARRYTYFLNDQSPLPSLESLKACVQFFALTKIDAMLPKDYSSKAGINLTDSFSINLLNPRSTRSSLLSLFVQTKPLTQLLSYNTNLSTEYFQSKLCSDLIPHNSLLVFTPYLIDGNWKDSFQE